MSERRQNTPTELETFKEALFEGADATAAHLAREKERFLASLDPATTIGEVRAHRPRFRFRPAYTIAMAAAVAAVLAVVFIANDSGTPPAALPRAISGLVRLKNIDLTTPEQELMVPEGAGAKVVWPDDTALWLAARTRVALTERDGETVSLKDGRLLAAVTPKGPAAVFEVDTPAGKVTVHGTVFSVSCDADTVIVRLHEGKVTFTAGPEQVTLRPGTELRIDGGKAPVVSPIDDAGVLQDLMIAERTEDLAGPPVPVIGSNIEMSPLDVVVTRPAKTESPEPPPSERKPAGTKRGQQTTTDRSPVSATQDAPVEKPRFVDPDIEAIEMRHHPGEQQGAVPLIEAMIRQKRYEEAIDIANRYLNANPGSEDADKVLYLRGYCEMRRGNLKAGRQAFETYLVQFPEGRQWQKVQEILGE